MTNPIHNLYWIISTVIIAGLLSVFNFVPFFQSKKVKKYVLLGIAAATILLKTSEWWLAVPFGLVDYSWDSAYIGNVLPMSVCTVSMMMLLIVSLTEVFIGGGVAVKWLEAGTAYFGFWGAVLTVYITPITETGWDLFQNWSWTTNTFGHSVLILGCLYLFTGRFVEVKVSNVLPSAAFDFLLISLGWFWIFLQGYIKRLNEMDNPMYLLGPAFNIHQFNLYVLLILCHAVTVPFLIIYELYLFRPENRFYNNFNSKSYWLD
jgi:hypothetical protein